MDGTTSVFNWESGTLLTVDVADALKNSLTVISEFGSDRSLLKANGRSSSSSSLDSRAIDLVRSALEVRGDGDGQEIDAFLTGDRILGIQTLSVRSSGLRGNSDQARNGGNADSLIGVIDSGFATSHRDLNYDNLLFGNDLIDNDNDPLTSNAIEAEHGTNVLGIVGATRSNDFGIDGVNDQAKIWLSRAIGSSKWADSVIEFVDKAKSLGQKNAVLNLSFELTEISSDGSVTPRTQLTSAELAALDYARQNQVIIVAAAGNSGVDQMSALGRASRLFDNILTVGAADGDGRADYSNYGESLDILANGGTLNNPVFSLSAIAKDGIAPVVGTSIATAEVTGAISRIWDANPDLNYRQVLDVIKKSARDLGQSGWDAQTGFGLLDIRKALELVGSTAPTLHDFVSDTGSRSLVLETERWYDNGEALASERTVGLVDSFKKVVDTFNPLKEAEKQISGWIDRGKNEVSKKLGNLTALVRNSGISGLKNEISGYVGRLNSARSQLDNLFDRVEVYITVLPLSSETVHVLFRTHGYSV